MHHRIFLAGASGAIGRRLTPLLRDAGHHVAGMTRSPANTGRLRALGVEPVVVDVFDAASLTRAVGAFRPDIVIHQLTDLPQGLDPARMGEAIERNARIRDEGTYNLVRAALNAGARRLVAQSIAWAYASGPEPHRECDPLDFAAEGSRATSVRGVAALEGWALSSPQIEGIVLRYGQIYGPGTGREQPNGSAPLHVDAAAWAALLACEKGRPGIYNIADDNSYVSLAKSRLELGWAPDFRSAFAEYPDSAHRFPLR